MNKHDLSHCTVLHFSKEGRTKVLFDISFCVCAIAMYVLHVELTLVLDIQNFVQESRFFLSSKYSVDSIKRTVLLKILLLKKTSKNLH